jgi:citrate lyase beta subunit
MANPSPATALTADHLASIDQRLTETDRILTSQYPGDRAVRQPVHTVYLPADRYSPDLAERWGAEALAAVDRFGGAVRLAAELGVHGSQVKQVAAGMLDKLRSEPIEDLRLDFEDGYGMRDNDEEDAHALGAAVAVTEAIASGQAPPFIGIRFKSLERPTRHRGLRTLDLFIGGLVMAGDLPDGLVLTLPKVSASAQVEAMVFACERLEAAHGLHPGRLRFEVQVETPQVVLSADGTVPVASMLHRSAGRITSLHYGTYDYSASLGIAAGYQSMEHPAADHAKQVMQVAVAGTGVHLSDGSTSVIPTGEPSAVLEAWRLHARLVRRSLERGYYQGWDLHPAQLPTRFIATYAFYRDGLAAACTRLRHFVHKIEGGFMDEPATARALAGFVWRAVTCGAATIEEVTSETGMDFSQLTELAHPSAKTNASPTYSSPTK